MDLELQCMKIISNVGTAKSMYIMAIQEAKKGNFDEARRLIEQGLESFTEGHHAHFEVFTGELDKDFSQGHFLLIHAEDQLMAADSFKIIAEEIIEVYERIKV